MNTLLQALQDFHFLRPWWLLGIVPAALLVALLWQRKASYGSWDKVISPHLLPHLMQGGQAVQHRGPLLVLLTGWLLACLAMAGPTWQKLPQAVQKKVDAQVIVLDLSLSMYSTDLAPSRLLRARMKLTDILARSKEGLTALVVFAGTAHVVTPLTDDSNTILSMVNSLSPDIMPIKGSDAVAAVKKALEVLKQGGVNEGRILLMTDGVPANFIDELRPVITASTPVSIMGIGTRDGAPIPLPDGTFVKGSDGQIVVPRLNIDSLKQAARQLGGRFSTLSASDDDLDYLLADTRLLGGNEIKDARREFDVWDEAGPWLVVLLLPLAALGYRRGWLGAMLLPLVLGIGLACHSAPAAAFGWADLWKTPDQQGQQLLREGNPKAAAETFTNPAWKGTSYYRGGDFEAAANAFAQQDSTDSQYNLGNALARQQKFDEAIASYEKVLQQDPNHEDARFNLELVKRLKEQQQQQQENQNNDDPSDSKDKQQKDKQDQQQNDEQQKQQDQQQSEQQDEQEQKQQQDQQKREQDEQSRQQEQPKPDEQDQDQQERNQQPMPQPKEMEQSEDQQALEQWLRRIPDDPGGLLRRKFQKETQLHKTPSNGDSTW